MGDEDKGDAEFFLELFEFDAHLGAELGVEGAEGFVEKEDLGFAYDGAGEGDALTLAAAELGGLAIDEGFERGHLHHAVHALADLGGRDFFHSQAEGDVFVNREVGEEGVILKNLIHIAPVGRLESQILAVQKNLP